MLCFLCELAAVSPPRIVIFLRSAFCTDGLGLNNKNDVNVFRNKNLRSRIEKRTRINFY